MHGIKCKLENKSWQISKSRIEPSKTIAIVGHIWIQCESLYLKDRRHCFNIECVHSMNEVIGSDASL